MGLEEWVGTVFRQDVRFFGAGVMGVAAIWTLVRIAGPVLGGIRSALATGRARRAGEVLALEERDLPVPAVIAVALALLAPIGWLLWSVLAGTPLEGQALPLIAGALLFILAVGLGVGGGDRLHGRPDRRVELPPVGRRDPGRPGERGAAAGLFGRTADPQSTRALVAYALAVTASCSASPPSRTITSRISRPASSSRDTLEAAGCPDRRRGLRLGDHPAGP